MLAKGLFAATLVALTAVLGAGGAVVPGLNGRVVFQSRVTAARSLR